MVRRAASRPISIIRSTSVPTQLQDGSHQQAVPSVGGGSGGNATTSKRGLHVRDRSLQHDFNFNSSTGAGLGGVAQSLPIPQAPMLGGSLPPSRFLDDLPPLSLPPQVLYLNPSLLSLLGLGLLLTDCTAVSGYVWDWCIFIFLCRDGLI